MAIQEILSSGEFLNLSVLATPCYNSLAPLGLSKYSHIADGCLDIVLVQDVKRKEFMKFMRRNGNSKNQVWKGQPYLRLSSAL